ncbi:hypothetical protein N8T08_005493 [Aspergillus melleus]|uniref:Uncharacterized protein n=1 Tax=Aspergillus melleus TaxID=138277 RepID=A0ACC3B241_9EURO|nr:hypothetical protein N8T08_005493 [Aspergillus melleus]
MTSLRETGGRDQTVRGDPQELMQYQRYRDWTEHQVLLDADEFITKYELHDLRDILRKGALLTHDPTNTSYAEELTRDPPILANTIAVRPPSIRCIVQFVLFVVAAGACGMMAPGYPIYEYDSSKWIYVMSYLAGCIFTALLSRFLTSHKIMLAFGAIGFIRPLVEALCLEYYSGLQSLFLLIPIALILIFFVMRAVKKFGLRNFLVGTILLDLFSIWMLNLLDLLNMWDAMGYESGSFILQVMWKTALVTMSVGSFSPAHRGFGVSVVSLFFYGSILLVELLAKAHVYYISNHLFGVLDVAALVLVTLFTIDVSVLSLEEIQTKLAIPLDKVASYRIRVELPYLFHRYCLRRDVELVPLDEYYPCLDEIALSEV